MADLSPAAIWIYKNTGAIPFLESPTEPSAERTLPRMAKICRFPKDSKNTVINANIGDISDTVHSQVPSHHVL